MHGNSGSRNPNSKLLIHEVMEIRQMVASGWHPKWLADKYKVSEDTIRNIAKGRSWTHVPQTVSTTLKRNQKLTEAEKLEIVRLYVREGLTQAEIASRFHVTQPHVSNIIRSHG